jgi:hypothetical protein
MRDAATQIGGGAQKDGSSQYILPDALSEEQKKEVFQSVAMRAFLSNVMPRSATSANAS